MVGQFENSLMPWRISGSDSTSIPLNLTPMWLSTWTTRAEKPHCGKTGVPFMNSTTGLAAISLRMRSKTGFSSDMVTGFLFSDRLGGEGQRMQLAAHPRTQRRVDELMLLHTAASLELGGAHMGGVVVAVAAQILDRDLRVRQTLADQALDRRRVHRHGDISSSAVPTIWPRAAPGRKAQDARICLASGGVRAVDRPPPR